MGERMTQVLGNLRAAVGPDKWDAFFEAMYDAFGNHDELDGENAVLFEQVQVLKRENDRLRCELDRVQGEQEERDGLIRMPVDVDEVPICIGDELVDISDTYHRGKVRSIELKEDGWIVFVGNLGRWSHAYRHVKPDSWERIIEDVRRRTSDYYCNNIPCDFREMAEEMVARCKALCERTMSGDAE